MNEDHYSDQLEQLIKDKDVNALTPAEQKLVIRELGSLDEYARLRSIAAKSQEVFGQNILTPSSAVLGNILSRVEAETKPAETMKPIYLLPLPLYQAAAAVVLAIGLTWWWTQSRLTIKSDPIVITLVDTVYQEVVRVDTIQVASPSTLIHDGVTDKSPGRSIAKSAHVTTAVKSSPDYRFSRGDFPIASAHRSGQSLQEQTFTFALDSMPGMEHVFAADKVF